MTGVTVKLNISGLDKLIKETPMKVSNAVRATALQVEAQAKLIVPVDTGFLKSSIQTEMTGNLTAQITPHAEYAAYVEFGTKNMAAQPYLIPAMEKAKDYFEKWIKAFIK